ncbi:alpha/beta hydrolase, partial [Xanthomonas citri pv. citri]|nr:alpha/beta hydrolase [Xanthomonas citri pv. citri]
RLRGPKHPSKLLDKLSFGAFNKAFEPARTDFDWLSRDEAEVDAYVADEMCGFVCTAGFYVDMLGGLRRVNTPSFVAATPSNLPILVVSGGA